MPLAGSCTSTIAFDVVENAYNRITTHLDEYIAKSSGPLCQMAKTVSVVKYGQVFSMKLHIENIGAEVL